MTARIVDLFRCMRIPVREGSVDRLDRKDLKDAPFDLVLRGYDKRQVDERLRFLGAELAAAEDALWISQARAATLEVEMNQVRSESGSADSSFGARVEKILLLAEEEASAVRGEAGAEAAALLGAARAEADEQRRQVAQELAARQAEAEKIRTEAAQQADQLCQAAAHEADEMRKVARGQAAQLVEQARAEADRLLASANESAQQRERASAQELHRLSRVRDQINAELYRAKNLLDGLFPAAAKGGPDGAAPGRGAGEFPAPVKGPGNAPKVAQDNQPSGPIRR
jgi:cell division septum initiation protein DivIVA